ncbi:MAG: iron-binding protein [Alphaproteobacteria bacterium]|nr:iron-binding protein [Alphaproteobacteria bacterium]
MPHDYKGEQITVHFDGRKCIHSRLCVLGLPHVFTSEKIWIKPDEASAEAVVEIAHKCPSGAITYTMASGEAEAPPVVNTIRVRENGPLELHGDLRIDGGDPVTRAVLCRCGLSKRKPFCDNAHIKGEFVASGEREPKESEPLETRNGPLEITSRKNRSYKVEGNVEIIAGSGRQIDRRTMVGLCRCGKSKNKPFCDGSHKAAGFEADGAE